MMMDENEKLPRGRSAVASPLIVLPMVCVKDVRELDEGYSPVYSASCTIQMNHANQSAVLVMNGMTTPFFELNGRYIITVEKESDYQRRVGSENSDRLRGDRRNNELGDESNGH